MLREMKFSFLFYKDIFPLSGGRFGDNRDRKREREREREREKEREQKIVGRR